MFSGLAINDFFDGLTQLDSHVCVTGNAADLAFASRFILPQTIQS
ncbi:hypothetical protein IMCC9480_758 [Oxalobacteraceae bacterium IMCC9480]|nr:hypothetical protein IMCC9480_758 [Oxalobacteraceae bacterium IMCC9480]